MSLTISASLKSQLDACTTKLAWANTLKSVLGSTRRVRAWKNSNAGATDPSIGGTEFLNVGMTGEMTLVAGNITNFGVLSGTSISAAADLSTGSACIRVEGNGQYIQASLGLTGSNKDYMLTGNPNGTAGFGFSTGAGAKAPALLNSGTGPLAPSMPTYTAEIENWTGGSFVGVVGILTASKRLINWVYDDQEMATSQGDVLTLISPTTVVHGEIEFGMMLWALNGVTNAENSDPVDEILITQKPVASNWSGYPRYSGYDAAVSNTYAPPFKVRIKKDGVVVKVHEMRDGLAINDQTLNQTSRAGSKSWQRGVDTAPIRPFVGCGVVLPFRSRRLKMHTYAQKYYPGQEVEVLRASTSKQKTSCNAPFPMYYAANTNGLNNWHGLGKWATAANTAAFNANPSQDPMLFSIYTGEPMYGSASSGVTNVTGWGFEYGANGGQDWWTGNGGGRIDRGAIPGPIAIHMTDPTYVHKRDNTPILEMVDNWNLNYCNIPWHMIQDLTTGATIPFDEVCAGMWCQGGNTYYGGQDVYVPGGRAYSINFLGWGNGPSFDFTKPFDGARVDKNQLMPFQGASTDFLHAYKSAAPVAYLYNSPMAAYLAKFAVINVILAQLGDLPANAYPVWFLVRQHAWRFKAYCEGWKLSSDHPWGMKREFVVSRFRTELETIYDTIYTTAVINNGQDPYSLSLKNLGLPVSNNDGNGFSALPTQSLMFYMAGVFQQMKSTGCWDYMRALSVKCRTALDFMVQCMDRYSIDWIIQTNGQYDWYEGTTIFVADASAPGGKRIANNWSEVAVNRRAQWASGPDFYQGQWGTDWVTNVDGSLRGEADGSQHLRYQWACIRRDWITESEVPRGSVNTIADGISKYKSYYDKIAGLVAARVASDPNNGFAIRQVDWSVRQPMYGVIKPPISN